MRILKPSLSFVQLQQLKAACRKDRERAVLSLILETQATAFELSRLERRHVKWSAGALQLPGHSEDSPISACTLQLVSRYFRFRESFGITARQVQRIVGKLGARAGITQAVTPQVLRRAGAPTGETPPSAMFLALVEAVPDGVLVADDERRCVYVNPAAVKIIGVSRGQILGRRIDDFFTLGDGASMPSAWEVFLRRGYQYGVWQLVSPASGRVLHYSARASFVPGLHLAIIREGVLHQAP